MIIGGRAHRRIWQTAYTSVDPVTTATLFVTLLLLLVASLLLLTTVTPLHITQADVTVSPSSVQSFVAKSHGGHHNRDPVVNPDLPYSNHEAKYCYNCSSRCDHVLAAIQGHTLHISARDRLFKLREIAASLPRFFRGLDHLFLEDIFHLHSGSKFWSFSGDYTRPFVDADMHMYNFGSFHNAIGEVIYDMNDFDQSFIGDYHIDLWRTSTSIVIHMNINGITDINDQRHILHAYAQTYVRTVKSFIHNDNELIAYLTESSSRAMGYTAITDYLHAISRDRSREALLEDYCYFNRDGHRRLDMSRPDIEMPSKDEIDALIDNWDTYIDSLGTCHRHYPNETIWRGDWTQNNVSTAFYFTIKSIAKRIGAGLGSLGQPRFYVLIEGLTSSQSDDILLDIKREILPEWATYVHGYTRRVNSVFRSEAHRVCMAIHALNMHVDYVVGYLTLPDGASFIVRSRSPYKGAVDVDGLRDKAVYTSWSQALAYMTAINHARADVDFNPRLIPYQFETELAKIIPHDQEHQFAENLAEFAWMNAQRISEDFDCYVRSGMADATPY